MVYQGKMRRQEKFLHLPYKVLVFLDTRHNCLIMKTFIDLRRGCFIEALTLLHRILQIISAEKCG